MTVLSKQKPQILKEAEKLLLILVNCKQLTSDSMSKDVIYAKARLVYRDLMKKEIKEHEF